MDEEPKRQERPPAAEALRGANEITFASKNGLYRRIAFRLLPFLFLCYVMSILDRANVSFGKLQFTHDLGIGDLAYGSIAGVFYLGYVLFEVPSNLMLVRSGVRKTLLRIMLLWGAMVIAMGFARTSNELYYMRFLLGAAEAGLFPGVILYLSFWFPEQLRGRITSLFVLAAPVAGVIGGPIAGHILQEFDGVAGLRGWRWLFIIEGIPALMLGFAALWMLPNRPTEARWLSAEDGRHVMQDLAGDRTASHVGSFLLLRKALANPWLYILAIGYCTIPLLNVTEVWVPTIFQRAGVKSYAQIGWWAGATSIGAAIGVLVAGRSSDYFQDRRWHLVAFGLLGLASYSSLSLVNTSVPLTALLLGLGAAGGYGVLTLFWSLPPARLRVEGAPLGIAFISSVGFLGGSASPTIVGWTQAHTGSLYEGLIAVASIFFLGTVMLFVALSVQQARARHLTAGAGLAAAAPSPS